MAFISRNKIVTVNRGDTFILPIELNIGSGARPIIYDMAEGDILYLAVLEPNQRWEDAILKKTFTYQDYRHCNDNVEIEFSTEDTEYLLAGNYYYQAKLYIAKDKQNHNNESVTTVVPKTKFIIVE